MDEWLAVVYEHVEMNVKEADFTAPPAYKDSGCMFVPHRTEDGSLEEFVRLQETGNSTNSSGWEEGNLP